MDAAALDGFCVGITADRRWEEQAELLRRRGATVLHGASIRTLPMGFEDVLKVATEDLIRRPPHYLVANTGIGIRAWFASAESWGLGPALMRALSMTKIYARGPKASGAVHSAELEVADRAPSERLREVVDRLVAEPLRGKRVAVQHDGGGPSDELERLKRAGAEIVEIPVYEWRMPDDERPAVRLIEAVVGGRVHAVTFTSGPAVRNLVAIAGEHDLDRALLSSLASSGIVVACVGPVCAEVAVAEGIPDVVVPGTARLGPMIREVTARLVDQATAVRLRAGVLSLQGTVARIGDDRIDLTDTEARLLALLAARPGAVITKADLLRRVWGDPDGDPHVVEVTVGRVRRRLGRFGGAIQSVPRRGYRLAASAS